MMGGGEQHTDASIPTEPVVAVLLLAVHPKGDCILEACQRQSPKNKASGEKLSRFSCLKMQS